MCQSVDEWTGNCFVWVMPQGFSGDQLHVSFITWTTKQSNFGFTFAMMPANQYKSSYQKIAWSYNHGIYSHCVLSFKQHAYVISVGISHLI